MFAHGGRSVICNAKVQAMKHISFKMVTKCEYLGYTYEDVSSYKVSLILISLVILIIALPAMLLNGSILVAIYRKAKFHVPAYFIISNLALTDLMASVFTYNAYAVICIMFVARQDACNVALIVAPVSYLLGFVSYQTVVYQAVERYIAIFYPLWYHERFHNKYALLGVAIVWGISVFSTALWFTVKNSIAIELYFGVTSVADLFVVIFCHTRILCQVRKTQRQISEQLLNQEERKKFIAESRVAKVTATILSAFLMCYLAELTMLSLSSTSSKGKAQFGVFQYWSWFLCLANSIVNPIIILHQLRTLRKSVVIICGVTKCFSAVSSENQSTSAMTSQQ